MHATDSNDTVSIRALRQLRALFAGAVWSDGGQRHHAEVSFPELKYWSAIAAWGLGERPAPEVHPHEVVAFADVVRDAVLPLTAACLEMGLARLEDTVRRFADRKVTFKVVGHDVQLVLELLLHFRKKVVDAGLAGAATQLEDAAESAADVICRILEAEER